MATSDSDAFESADEELSDEPLEEQRSLKKGDSKEVINQQKKGTEILGAETVNKGNDSSPQKDNTHNDETTVKTGTNSKKTHVLEEKISTDSKIHQDNQSKDSNKEFQDVKDNDGWDDFDVEDNSESKQEEPTSKPGNVEQDDGWDFDDWGEEDIKTHVAPKPEAVHSDKEYRDLADKLSSLRTSGSKPDEGQSGWSGWGGWGASLLSSGVSQLTTHVSQGLNTVSSVIESGMGVPNPEEFARVQKESNLKTEDSTPHTSDHETGNISSNLGTQKENNENPGGFQLGKFVSSVTKLVESTSTTVITGGLDTLEEIGKRTMKVIQGDEPGGRVKLSTLLREARDKSERQDVNVSSEGVVKKRTPSFEILFDDYQGLVHLEALEMLSKQCDIKLLTLANKCQGSELKEFQETLEQVKEICELPELEEDTDNKHDVESFHQSLTEATADMGVQLTFELILNCWKEIFDHKQQDSSSKEESEIEESVDDKVDNLSLLAIKKMAQYSALSVQLLHKCAALLSVRERRSTADEADGLTQLTAILSHRIGNIASEYSNELNKLSEQCETPDKVKSSMTNVYLEAEKGSSYIKDAFLLTIPILQVGAT